jgi:hypothetical protein
MDLARFQRAEDRMYERFEGGNKYEKRPMKSKRLGSGLALQSSCAFEL